MRECLRMSVRLWTLPNDRAFVRDIMVGLRWSK